MRGAKAYPPVRIFFIFGFYAGRRGARGRTDMYERDNRPTSLKQKHGPRASRRVTGAPAAQGSSLGFLVARRRRHTAHRTQHSASRTRTTHAHIPTRLYIISWTMTASHTAHLHANLRFNQNRNATNSIKIGLRLNQS